MKYIVDRIEDNIVVLENQDTKEIINIDMSLLPKKIKEGNILIYKNNSYYIDKEAEIKRKKEILEKFKKLRNKNN